jgi:hypothetical protein
MTNSYEKWLKDVHAALRSTNWERWVFFSYEYEPCSERNSARRTGRT